MALRLVRRILPGDFGRVSVPHVRDSVSAQAFALDGDRGACWRDIIWGFGHAGYAQQPFWIRGVEVGTGGVALGIIMLRWGILPTLVWHYSVDAMYSAMLLLRSHSLYFRLSGAASAGFIVLPALVALMVYWRRGGFEPVAGLLNGDEPGPVEPAVAAVEAAPAGVSYAGLDRRVWGRGFVVLAIGLTTLRLPMPHLGESPKYKLNAGQALAKSDTFLRGLSLDPARFRHVTFPDAHWSGPDSLAGQYFLQRKPVSEVAAMFEKYRPIQHWVTRYFKPLDQEEVTVSIHPETGAAMGFGHTLPEDRAGASLSKEAARNLAASFAEARGQDVSAMDLKEETVKQLKARSDHSLAWEARAGDPRNVDETRYRVEVGVAGAGVSDWRAFWRTPEAFDRERDRQNFWSILATVARIAALAAIFVFALAWLIRNIRGGLVPWKPAIAIGGVAAICLAAGALLGSGLLMRNYPTSIPFETFQITMYAGIVITALFGFIFFAAAAALVISSFPDCLAAWRTGGRRVFGKDALAALAACIGLGLIVTRVSGFLQNHFHALAFFSPSSPELIATPAPVLSAITSALTGILVFSGAIATLAVMLRRLKPIWMVSMAPIAVAALVPSDARTAQEFAFHYGLGLFTAALAALWCWRFARNNYLAYGLAFWAVGIQGHAAALLGTEIPAMQAQGWAVVATGALVAIWVVGPAFVGKRILAAD